MIGALFAQTAGGESVDPMCWSCRRSPPPHRGASSPAASPTMLSDAPAMGLMAWIGSLGRQLVPDPIYGSHGPALGELVVPAACWDCRSSSLLPSGRPALTPVAKAPSGSRSAHRNTILFGVLFSPSLTEYPGVRNPLGIEAIRDATRPGRDRLGTAPGGPGGFCGEPRAPVPEGRRRGASAAEMAGVVGGAHRNRLAPARGDLLGRRARDARGMAGPDPLHRGVPEPARSWSAWPS